MLQRLLWEDWNKKFAMYATTAGSDTGYIFYRNLIRAQIPDIPLVLVIKKRYQDLDKLLTKDRDRTAFGGATLEKCYALFARHALKGDAAAQRIVVEAAQHCWIRGHSLLSAMADYKPHGWSWPRPVTEAVFGDHYYAESADPHEAGLLLEYQAMEGGWKAEGRQRLPQYFAAFGVITAKQRRSEMQLHIVEQHQRPPTSAEDAALASLIRLMEDLTPSLTALFKTKRVSYVVAQDDVIAGELRKGRGYMSQIVFLEEDTFELDFAPAVALFLHEHSHIFGWDGSRGFTDELTRLLETVIRWRYRLDPYEAQWNAAREVVLAERQHVLRTEAEQIDTLLQEKTMHDLRALLKKLSPTQVRTLIETP